jgi:hypothetical protein
VSESRDILREWRTTTAVFLLPTVFLVATGFFNISLPWRAVIWAIALVIMGSACLANAMRCGRVHCFLTGPFFLLMAIVSLLYGFGIIPLLGKAGILSGWLRWSVRLASGGFRSTLSGNTEPAASRARRNIPASSV